MQSCYGTLVFVSFCSCASRHRQLGRKPAEWALNGDFLPEKVMRAENQSEAQDKAFNQAYDNVANALKLYKERLDLAFLDNKKSAIVTSVHFGENFDNACKPALGQAVWWWRPMQNTDA